MRLFYPKHYIRKQIKSALLDNDKVDAEKVWTFLVGKKYEDNQSLLIKKVCRHDEIVPNNSTIWLEGHLDKTRYENNNSGEVIPDMSFGCLEQNPETKARVVSNGNWICTVEAKWGSDDRLKNSRRNQFAKLIESSLLLESKTPELPERVYVILLTPEYMTFPHDHFEVTYYQLYEKYKNNYKEIIPDLECKHKLKKYSQDFLNERIRKNLILNWATYEDLLGIDNLMETKIPDKYQTTRKSWKEVFIELKFEKLYQQIIR